MPVGIYMWDPLAEDITMVTVRCGITMVRRMWVGGGGDASMEEECY